MDQYSASSDSFSASKTPPVKVKQESPKPLHLISCLETITKRSWRIFFSTSPPAWRSTASPGPPQRPLGAPRQLLHHILQVNKDDGLQACKEDNGKTEVLKVEGDEQVRGSPPPLQVLGRFQHVIQVSHITFIIGSSTHRQRRRRRDEKDGETENLAVVLVLPGDNLHKLPYTFP